MVFGQMHYLLLGLQKMEDTTTYPCPPPLFFYLTEATINVQET